MKTFKIIIILSLILHLPSFISAQKYQVFDAVENFTTGEDGELYQMEDCGSCDNHKRFEVIDYPKGVPLLSDGYAQNNKCYEMYFPSCQYATYDNPCKKCMVEPDNQKQFPFGTDVWHALSIYVPEDFNNIPFNNLIYQFHAWPDGFPGSYGSCDTWRSPPFAIRFRDDKWLITGGYTNLECNRNGNEDITFMHLQNEQPIVKGGWSHLVINVRFDYNGNGRAQVWLKDDNNSIPVKIVDYSGALGFNDDRAPYNFVSFGWYYQDDMPDATLYFDRVIFAGANESLESMMYTAPTSSSNGCNINIDATAVGEINNNSNGSIELNINGGESPYDIMWSDGSISEDREDLSEGTYSVTVTDQKGCEVSDVLTINNEFVVANNYHPVIDIIQSSQSLFGGSILELDASGSYDLDGDALEYNWTIPESIDANINSSEDKIKMLLPDVANASNYEVYLELSDGFFFDTDTIELTINPFPNRSNVLLVSDIYANSYEEPNIPENTVDKDYSTRWSAEGNNEELILSLKNLNKITDLSIAFYNRETSYAYFDIFASDDSTIWKPLLLDQESCGFSSKLHVFSVPDKNQEESYSYIKFVGKGNSNSGWNSLSEISLYGTSITKGGETSNSKPIIVLNYEESVNSGTVNKLSALGSFDPDGEDLTYRWIAPDNVSLSGEVGVEVDYLAPEVFVPTTKSFVLEVNDGIETSYKSVEITFTPYRPEVDKIHVASIKASYFDGDNHPVNLLDGDPDTYWSVKGDNQWVEMELSESVDISHLKVAFHGMEEKKSRFDLLLSQDNENWEYLFEDLNSCGFSSNMHLLELENTKKSSASYKYVKIVGHGTDIDDINSISELEVFGNLISTTSVTSNVIEQIKIYPNPASNFFTIELIDSGIVSLFDITGKSIFREYLEKGKHTLTVNYPKGCYIISLQSGDNTNVKKQKLIIK